MIDDIHDLVKAINKMAKERNQIGLHHKGKDPAVAVGWVGVIPSYVLSYNGATHHFKADRIGAHQMERGFIDTDDLYKVEEKLRLEAVKMALEIE